MLWSLMICFAVVVFAPLEDQDKGIALWTLAALHGLAGAVWWLWPGGAV